MAIGNAELLQKATLTTTDFGGAGEAPLSIAQVREFIKLLSAKQVFLPDVRRVTSTANKWQESIVDFGGRITKPGVEAERLASGERVKPTTGSVEISTVLLRAEVPVSDESLEDNVAESGFANDLEMMIADQFGSDVEELMLQGDTASGDAYLKQLDGWIKQAQGAKGHVLAASSLGKDYQSIFKKLLQSVPIRHQRNLVQDGRYYVPVTLEQEYRDILSSRGTPLGGTRAS
jgi:HK97 family phage major capsid protein